MANENNDKDKEEKSQLSSDSQEVLPAEVLEALPKDLRSVAIRAASFRGPLPPPHMFSSYEETLPGRSRSFTNYGGKAGRSSNLLGKRSLG